MYYVNLETILSNTNVAPSDAQVAPTLLPLPQLLYSAHCRPTASQQAIDLSIWPTKYKCQDNQNSWVTGHSGDLHQPPGFLTTTGHTLPLMEREDDAKHIDPFALSLICPGLTNEDVACHSPACKEYWPKTPSRMTQWSTTVYNSSFSKVVPETPNSMIMQWQAMCQFHSQKALWPFPHAHQSTTTTMPEELVFTWTLLQPTLDNSWQQMYAWNDQLTGLIQAINDSDFQSTHYQFSQFFKGASISKALWNSPSIHWSIPKLKTGNLTCLILLSQATPVQHWLTNQPSISTIEPWNLQQQTGNQQEVTWQNQPLPGNNQVTCRNNKASFTASYLHNTTHDQETSSLAVTSLKHHSPYAVLDEGTASTLAATLSYLDQNAGGAFFNVKPANSPSTRRSDWHHWQPHQKQLAWYLNWCQCWIATIIQQFWDMAWDILAHWNVESTIGAWPACNFSHPGVDFWLTFGLCTLSFTAQADEIVHLTCYHSTQISGLLYSSPVDM